MNCEVKCCTFLRGEFYIGDSLSNCDQTSGLVCGIEKPLKKVGNVEGATITISSQILGTENKFHYKNNNNCARVSIQSVDISLAIKCTSIENMNLALLSKNHVGDFMVGYVQDFIVCDITTLRACNFFLFKKSGVILGSITVRLYDEFDVLIQPLTEDVDYVVNPHGVEMIKDIMAAGVQKIRITYNYDDRAEAEKISEFNFLSEFQGHKFLYFKGTNYADGQEDEDPFGVEIYRVLFNPVSQIDLISQGNYFLINLVGKIEQDHDKTEDGLGGYFKIKRGRI